MSDLQIRRARVAEADTLVAMWVDMMREHEAFDRTIRLSPNAGDHYRSYLQMHLLDTNSLVIVALRGEEIVGYTLAMKCQNLPMFQPTEYGYISDMTVRRNLRGKQIGQRMFDRAVEWFRQQGLTCMQLQVYHGNEAGRRFWERLGLRDFISRCWMDL